MLILLSPAKKLNFSPTEPPVPCSVPEFGEQTRELAELMRQKTEKQLLRLQHISPSLAKLNFGRWQSWTPPKEPGEDCQPALFTFGGDVYQGLRAEQLSADGLRWAQQHVRILSGLHGLLRPMDVIRPYRLEMGTPLANSRGSDLYAMWRDQLTERLGADLAAAGEPWILNLASVEYASAVDCDALSVPTVVPQFQNKTRSGWRMVSFSAKRARGTMAAWAIERQLSDLAAVAEFDADGYRYEAELSEPLRPVFRRAKA